MGKQGKTATNKVNIINMIKELIYLGIPSNMACFCKLMAQNWHKKLTSRARLADLRMHAVMNLYFITNIRNDGQQVVIQHKEPDTIKITMTSGDIFVGYENVLY